MTTPASIPLQAFLTRLIWLCVLPVLLLATWLAYDSVQSSKTQRDQEAVHLAHNFATAIDQRLTERIRALSMLAGSPLLDNKARWGDLYQEAQGFQQNFGSHVILADVVQPIRMLFNTRLPLNSELPLLPRPTGNAAAPLAISSGNPAVSDSFVGPVAQEPLIAIAVPAIRQGKVAYILLTTLETTGFQKRLDLLKLPPGWALSLHDGRGDVIAQRGPANLTAPPDAAPPYRIVVPLTVSQWKVVLEIPPDVYSAPVYKASLTLGLGLLGATLIGVLGGMAASRRLSREAASLMQPPADGGPISEIAEIGAAQRRFDTVASGLRNSEERFRRLFAEVPLPMGYVGNDGFIKAQNTRFEQLFGYTSNEMPSLNDWWRLAYPDPAYRAHVQQNWNAAVAKAAATGADVETGEYQVTCKDGKKRFILISGIVMEDGVLAVFVDISEQRQAEDRLKLWAESFEHAELGLAISDARSNTFVAVNPAFAHTRGYERDELIGQPVTAMFPVDRLAEARRLIAGVDASTHGVFESEHISKDGRRFPVLLDITVMRDSDGLPTNRIVYALDLTERKQAEQALAAAQAAVLAQQKEARLASLNQMQDANAARAKAEAALAALHESQEQLKLFIEHAPASLAMFDREMRYLAVSRRWRDDYGLSDRELLGHSHYEIFPEIGDDWKSLHQRALHGEVIRADGDRFERADGKVQWVRWEIRPWNTAEGTAGGIVIFSEDVTRQKEAEEEIHRLNSDLERRVIERTAELSSANRELDSFAYAVSHDLRAPLRAMSGFSQALLEDFGDGLADGAKIYLNQISIASHRMSELIDGILALSRSTRGELRRDNIDISTLAARRLATLAQEDHSRRVNWQVEPGLNVTGDARMIEAVLENLLDNAWKYTGKTSLPEIRVHAEQRNGQRWICVADNGAGFDIAHAERLFKPFQRLHRQDEFPGIGIGLATVQRIVHRHGGEITARGEPGRGATFCITLPTATTSEESE